MIKIDRCRSDESGSTIQPDADWFVLSAKATFQAENEGSQHEVQESVYRHPEACRALEELFHRKCAYCESDVGNTAWNVEHFRPKGRVAERRDHPGYYWLTYEWSNLFPACEPCNQRRQDKPLWGDLSRARTAGKADQFPLVDEATRAMGPLDDVSIEGRLLLDPCEDNPEEHLRYDAQGQVFALRGSARGEASISVFHLDRRRLRDLRRKRIEDVIRLLRIIESLVAAKNLVAVRDLTSFLEDRFLHDSRSYAGPARFVVKDPVAFGGLLS